MARQSKANSDSAGLPLSLPPELTIYTVGELHPQWLAWLNAHPGAGTAVVEAQAVEQVDGAGLQLLLALGRGLEERGRTMRLQAPSSVLQSGSAALGLQDWLTTRTGEGAAA
jgi:ABC-type transporter Mla MlaB component